ncbi:MAG TPA: hypothetical protein VHB51_00455 [Candidatus Saccharimonadales bacterium]|nr:hypothetical protein [Candidatus Saccharimonadales bacterium]
MADRVVTTQEAAPAATTTGAARQTTVVHPGPGIVAARAIWWIAGVILVLLGFRFVLALLGANPSNGFANFIYTTSHPFVAPFFGLFSYDTRLGVSRFEIYTLIAMAVYAVIAWGLARLVTLNRTPHAAY